MAIKQPDDSIKARPLSGLVSQSGPDSGLVQSRVQSGASGLFNARARGDVPVLEVPASVMDIPPDIPEADRSPIPGMRKQDYMNYLERAVSGDDDLPPPFINYISQLQAEQGQREKDKKDFIFDLILEDMRRRIEQNIAALEASAAEWGRKAEQERQKMLDIERRMNGNQRVIDQIDTIFEKESKTGRLDREEALRVLRQRGLKVGDHASDKELHDLLLQEKIRLYNENLKLSGDYEAAQKAYEEYLRRQKEIQDAADRLKREMQANEQAARQPGQTDEQRSEIAKRQQELLENSDKWALRQNLERASEVSAVQKEAIESVVKKQLENVSQAKVYGDPMSGM